jgi:hypothetical protein
LKNAPERTAMQFDKRRARVAREGSSNPEPRS